MNVLRLFALALVGLTSVLAEPFLKPKDRVVFLGDSITMDGRYVAYLDLLLRTRLAEREIQLIPLGLASETACGLSEAHHPWPRPSVQERVDRALEKAKPTVLVFCYGMNDGIYAPFSEERFATYQKAVRELAAKGRAAQARVVILTPPPFDAASVSGKLSPDGAKPEDYGYMAPYADYNQVLGRYAAWLREEKGLADRVIDLHAPVTNALAEWRKTDPGWKSGDGVHPVAAVHWLLAALVAEGLGLPNQVGDVFVGQPNDQGVIRAFLFTPVPLPRDPEVPADWWARCGVSRRLNDWRLTVPKPSAARYALREAGKTLGEFTAEQLAKGLDLAALPELSSNAAAGKMLKPALARHRALGGAWRENVGHKRPQTDRNFPPLDQVLRQAFGWEEEIRKLAPYAPVILTLEPLP